MLTQLVIEFEPSSVCIKKNTLKYKMLLKFDNIDYFFLNKTLTGGAKDSVLK